MKLVNAQGIELAVECCGQGEPLIFAHGLSGSRQFTLEQLAPLVGDYRIVAYDQRGHGDSSPVTDPVLYNTADMLDDIILIADELGLDKFILGGESMGSAIALLFALKYPQRVKTLLLTAPAFSDQVNTEKERLQTMGQELLRGDMQDFLQKSARRMREDFNMPEKVIAKIAWMQSVHQPESLGTACMTVIEWQIYTDMQVLEHLAMPVCILAWANDPLHPLALAKKMTKLIPGASLIQLESILQMFADPASIGRQYKKYLQQI